MKKRLTYGGRTTVAFGGGATTVGVGVGVGTKTPGVGGLTRPGVTATGVVLRAGEKLGMNEGTVVILAGEKVGKFDVDDAAGIFGLNVGKPPTLAGEGRKTGAVDAATGSCTTVGSM